MKKILFISGMIFLIGIVAYFIFEKKQKIKNIPPKNGTIIIFGDSLAEGYGSTQGNDLASLLSEDLGRPVLNYGKSGDTTRDALGRLSEAAEKDPGVVIIILGGNDVLKKISKGETFDNLRKITTFFQDNGAAVVLFGVRSGLIGDGRGDDYLAVAKKTGSYYVSDVLKDTFGDPKYMSDPIHPNDEGYKVIERRLAPIIINIFGK